MALVETLVATQETLILPIQFYNAVLFMGSVAVFSLIAQRMNAGR